MAASSPQDDTGDGDAPFDGDEALPLSFAQERLWFIDRMEPGSRLYNVPRALRLGGALDARAFEAALAEIVLRHESLRTVFRESDGVPVQVIQPFAGFAVPVEDLSALDPEAREAETRRQAAESATRPFDLAAGPLIRAKLLRLGAEEHVLLLCLHHIVSDGWSAGVLFRELWTLYDAFREGRESPLEELPIQYADFALWQREHLSGDTLEREVEWWREQLAGAPAVLELPTDRPRTAVRTHGGALERATLPAGLLEPLAALAKAEGATLFMVLLGAFKVLLARYAGSDDVVVGTAIAGRTKWELQELIGFFVNTLVLRTDLSGDPGFRDVVRRVRGTTLGAYDHQELPFEKLVARLQPERSLSHSPLFQVMFGVDEARRAGGGSAGLRVEGVGTGYDVSKFDLNLGFVVESGRLRAEAAYSTDLFERDTVARMLGHLERVLEQAAADPDRPLSALVLPGEAERRQVVEEWNRVEADFPADRCIHELFQAQAARSPEAPAVTFQGESLTYAELNARANRLAHHLRGMGVGPETRVGICLERGPEMVVAILAVLKAGGAYVPLDPGYPADRLAYMLEDSGVPVLVTAEWERASLPVPDGVAVVGVDAQREEIGRRPSDDPVSGAGPESLAYVIYTSGSTGRPKGALIEHRNVARLFAATDAWFGFGPRDVWTLFHSYAFDFSVWEIWGALLYGGRVVVVPLETSRDPEAFHALVQREGVTVLSQTPSAFRQFIRADAERGGELALREVVFGGEALEPASLREWVERRGVERPRLVNMYGITETTVHVTFRVLDRRDVFEGSGSPIGVRIPDLRLYVLDPARNPQPVGVPGELYVGGGGVARGYLNRPELTEERFVRNPFGEGRLYRTGDRVRWLADGTLEYLGRLDEQVKIRGFRIELGEIEGVLRRAPGVADCAVVVREDQPGEKRLVAYVVGDADADALREHLRRGLPEYMVPAAFVAMETLPLTANGKLDRRALPAPEFGAAEDRYVAPRTPTEETLAAIWAEVLRLERVGVEESFFELGGHSLLVTQVASRVRETLGIELPLRTLFESPTVAGLAGRVEEIRRAGQAVLPPVTPAARTGSLPLSFAQERLWFLDRMQPGSAFYNIPSALRLAGALDVPALEGALGEIVRRHEALRTVFEARGGSPVQAVLPFAGFALPVDDLSALDGGEREAETLRRVAEDAEGPFDLETGPLFRARLLRLGAEEHVLLLCVHHVAADQWSLGVLFGELSALYDAFRAGAASPLAELPVQYPDFAVWQREHLEGRVLDGQLAWWKAQLAGAPALLELPTDRPRPAVQTHPGAAERLALPAELLERLRALGRREGATLYMTLLAAFQALLAKYAGSDDVVVGSPIAGRTRRETEELIGFFVNTLVLRTDLSGDPSFREALRRVRETTLGAFEHQEVPFEKLVAELQPERSLSHSPLFQVMFSVVDADGSWSGIPGVRTQGIGLEATTTKFDLNLVFTEGADRLGAVLVYNTDLFERDTARRMLGHLERLLEQVAADAERRLSAVELLGDEERRAVLAAANDTARPYSPAPAHALFAEQARRAPDAVALLHDAESVTYAALDRRSDALAARLRALGVGPEVPVGLCMERTPDLLTAVLGIWKAGGAYVPMDPGYPAERLAWIASDAGVPVIVTVGAAADALPEHGATVVDVNGGTEDDDSSSALSHSRTFALPHSLAYVIYTSGSTGRPKGVLVQHGSLSNLLAATREAFGVQPGDVMPALASFAFDIWLFEALLPLTSGAAVRIVARERILDPRALAEEIADATLLHAVPALMRQVAQAEREAPRLGRLRRAFVGGDLVPADLLAEMGEALPSARTSVLYGPTEGTILASTHAVAEDGVVEGHPIGRPFGNVRLYVCDALGGAQPVGVPGELLIGGPGVARGYHGRPELTADKFVPDPFSAEPGARLYRTGDRVRRRADGSLEFVGRVDGQVKIRGFRIEPGEIEARLAEHPAVGDVVVLAREDAPGEKRLVAYYVGTDPADAEALRAHLAERLPEYMVPAAFVRLEALPLTPNGKLDRKALPAPEGDAFASRAYEAPAGQFEIAVAQVWAEVLGVETVGRRDHFFEQGGHSLRAVQVVSRLRQALGVEVALGEVFVHPVLADFARALEQAGRAELPPIGRADRSRPLPLSFAQQRLWFVEQMGGVGSAYHIPTRLRLVGGLDRDALVRALDGIVARHEVLRTTFAQVEGEPAQRIAPVAESAFRLADHDLAGSADAEGELLRVMADEVAAPFDLVRGPLIRGRLVRLAADDHVLMVTMHHVVSDGWSMGVFVEELSALYGAFSRGEADPLPPLPVQYADYAAWQRRWVDGDVLREQAEFWKRSLAGAPELLELPTDRARPAQQDFAGATAELELDGELADGLRALARRHGATLFMTLLAGWAAVLARLSGQDDVVVGTPAANRGRSEIEGLIGFFINTLALRVDLSGSPTVAELLARVKAGVLAAQQRQDMPFEQVVELVQPTRSLAHNPLFQVVLAWQNAPRGSLELPGLAPGSLPRTPHATAQFDLSLTLQEVGPRIVGSVTYATALFERDTVERWIGFLRNVLGAMAADDRRRVDGLTLLPEAERSLVIAEWNRTARPWPRGVGMNELFDAQVAARPDAPALVWGDVELSYAELDARANRLAHHLRGLGVGPDARVGVMLERGVELVVSILAVIKAGGAYVPLDPGYPAERLRLMLEDSGVRVLLTRSDLASTVDADGLAVVHLDRAADTLAAQPGEPVRSGADPENLAYIVYTSGSTGRPKGVMVAHRHVVQLVCETDYVQFGPGDRVAQASNASFDALTFEAWGALLNGATLVGIPRDVLLSPPAFRAMLREQGITTLYQTTALLNQLSREQPDIFAPLREVLFGGQAADADSVRRLLKAGRPRRLLHMYGPTETTAWCSYESVEHVAEDALTVSVGRGTGNQRIYLLDRALNPVPVRVAGEAYVGGDGVVRGYLDRPALTAERFVPDPFAAEPGARMYRTGDRLRWKQDGRLEFVGRVDEQVKVRGFRIEPGEIEATLTAHADAREARVIVREDEPGEQRLVAYVVGGADADALREHLRRSLPEYMVPTAFVPLDRIPLTPNGKLDVRALPAPEYACADRFVAPRTPAEEVLAEIWAGVLKLEAVGVHDDFFQLGGHSLLATRVVSRAREVFGVELPVRAVFEGPTVAQLAERVEALRSAGASVLPPVVPVDRAGDLPLSFSQERLWFLDRMQPDSAFYNLCLALRLRGALDRDAIERALGEVVRRHEALRTVFPDRRGGPVQVILPFAGFTLPVEDIAAGGDDEEQEAEARRIASAEAARSFDLETGPLFRARLLRLGAQDHVLLVAMHHIVSDGWSLGVLFREISAHYGAFSEGRGSPLPELPVQYVDYAVWQREHQRGEILERQLAYWRDRLAGAPALLELPTDFPRPAVQTYRGAEERAAYPREVLEGLRELGRREGATLYMTLLAAFQVLLSKYSGSEDVVVGSPIAGRTRREMEELIGFFVNALALRTELSGDPGFREVLRRVRETTLSAYEHQAVSFEKLVAELQPERSLSHAPIFQVLFSVGEAGDAWRSMPGLYAESLGVEVATTTFDLNVVFAESRDGLEVAMAFNTDLFERATAQRMLGHMGQVLEQVAARPELRMSELEVVGEAERRRVVEEWNATAAPYPSGRCLHELFEEQVERTPEAVAVVFGDVSLSYAELNARANQLAHYLRERGVGPDERVGFCVERSLEMMTGLLAVLKAGGGYVPLDPAYPADRLRYMLEDSAPAAVLTKGAPRELFAGTEVRIIDLDAEAAAWADHPRANPGLGGLVPENLVYAIYTSGSTGRPKGVAMPHRPLVNLLAWQEPDWRYPRAAVTLQFTTISFDVSLQEIFSAWIVGGTLVVAPEEARHDPAALLELVEREGVERLSVPYVTLQHVAEHGAARGIAPPSLREAQTAGEQLRITDAIRRWFGAMGIPLHNHYGPSETHVMTSFALSGPAEEWPLLPSIGGPIANTTTYVLDRYLCPVPQGVPGELYLGGDCLARGYLNRPDMTAERFRPDPFGGEPGARMYRTGDRVRWLPDGTIDFLGRVDHQVKIRGVRIEPAEVEVVLRRHERVAECVVLVREDEPGDKRLVAYVVGGVEADALREHVRSCVPEYMVPSAFVLMDSLPATPNGKLDRRALPAPEYATDDERYVAPRTPVEEALAAIWSEVLGIERVGVQDNFFELGGHSLLATRVISRARDAFGTALSVRAIFEDPTIEGLARILSEQGSGGAADDAGRQPGVEASTTHQLLSMIDDLSEEELDRLLSAQS